MRNRHLIAMICGYLLLVYTTCFASTAPDQGVYIAYDGDILYVLSLHKGDKEYYSYYKLSGKECVCLGSWSGFVKREDNRFAFGQNLFAIEAPIDENGNQHDQIVQINQFTPGQNLPDGKVFRPFSRVDVPPLPGVK